jgi:hypothetical protein
MDGELLLVAVVDMADGQAEAGARYEDAVLALLARHGGVLEQRFRSTDATTEVQVIRFRDPDGYRDFMDDPARLARRLEYGDAVPVTRVIEVADPVDLHVPLPGQ